MPQYEYGKEVFEADEDLQTLTAAGKDGWRCFQLFRLDDGQWLAYYVREHVPLLSDRLSE